MQAREGPQEQAALSRNPGLPVHEIQAGEDGVRAAARRRRAPRRGGGGVVALTQPDPARTVRHSAGSRSAAASTAAVPSARPRRSSALRCPAGERRRTQTAVALNDSPATKPVDSPPTTKPAMALAAPTTSPVTDLAATQPVTLALKEPRPPTLPAGKAPATQPAIAQTPATLPGREADARCRIDRRRTSSALVTRPAAGQRQPLSAGGGDPGNKSESESDPFRHRQYHHLSQWQGRCPRWPQGEDGAAQAHRGRRAALLAMDQPMVEFGVHIDGRRKGRRCRHSSLQRQQ